MGKPKYIHFHLSKEQEAHFKEKLKEIGKSQKDFILETLPIITKDDVSQAEEKRKLVSGIFDEESSIRVRLSLIHI